MATGATSAQVPEPAVYRPWVALIPELEEKRLQQFRLAGLRRYAWFRLAAWVILSILAIWRNGFTLSAIADAVAGIGMQTFLEWLVGGPSITSETREGARREALNEQRHWQVRLMQLRKQGYTETEMDAILLDETVLAPLCSGRNPLYT